MLFSINNNIFINNIHHRNVIEAVRLIVEVLIPGITIKDQASPSINL